MSSPSPSAPLVAVDSLTDWLGQDVVGADGDKAGKLEELFLDGDGPVLAEIKSGTLRRKTHLIPLEGARVGRDYLRVAFAAGLIDAAPGREDDGAPDEATLQAVATHYGLTVHGSGPLEGSRARDERLASADDAERRARELEEEAARQAQTAEESGRVSDEARVARQRAEEDAVQARAEADRARGV